MLGRQCRLTGERGYHGDETCIPRFVPFSFPGLIAKFNALTLGLLAQHVVIVGDSNGLLGGWRGWIRR
jgi:hypothetical protein